MLRVNTEEERIIAVLHDVVEDTSVTLEQLANEGFSQTVLAAAYWWPVRQKRLGWFWNAFMGLGLQKQSELDRWFPVRPV